MNEIAQNRRARGRPRSAPADVGSVQAIDRAVVLLRSLARDGDATLTELADRANVPASSAHRVLVSLQSHGMVDFADATQEWQIGVEAFRIGSAFTRRTNIVDVAREPMRRLVEDTGETANLAIEDGGEVVFLAQVDTANPIRAFFRAGTRVPMHSSGIGKALLSAYDRARADKILRRQGLPEFTAKTLSDPEALHEDLSRTRARGWSFDDEERYQGMRCIAAPVWNVHGDPIAGVSISGPAVRFDAASLDGKGARVMQAAAEITEAMGGTPARLP
ncbi:HTH-type transcriptional regulator BhcR [Palleronia sp. KMU-117]|uniref:HTH-type transcriptional regulator BhcR n=1 Tax=Palleronia sp. KMU-117 TaxID=3434108 RepID=UPI003D739CD5